MSQRWATKSDAELLTYLSSLQLAIDYKFEDEDLLVEAVTHPSASNEHPDRFSTNNQRLEFLGDAVLDMSIASELFSMFPDHREGDLTKWRTNLVRGKTLAMIARSIELGSYLILGAGEEKSSGNDKDSNLSDAFEALIGAVFLDSGIEAVNKMTERLFHHEFAKLFSPDSKNPKGDLQELAASLGHRPKYALVEESGPEHALEYRVSVALCIETKVGWKQITAEGQGSSKRAAEAEAAAVALPELVTLVTDLVDCKCI
ncbi:MAG: ribonuclease III [Chloroflexi bacterium]|nr:ribonuclease III [Chloroflexota bacterium]|tara:strand:+ start:2674 stop:3450 length:777 start_codon:yes stop_codon:yes gene_type:complete